MAVIAAFAINALMNLVLGVLIAKLLGPADFGRFALATAGAVVLNTLLFEWLRLSTARFYSARVREHEPWIRAGLDRGYLRLGIAMLAGAALCAGLGLAIEPDPQGRLALTAGTAITAVGIGAFDYHAALARARFVGAAYLKLVLWKNLLGLVLMSGTAWHFPQPVFVLIAGAASQGLAVLMMRSALRDRPAGLGPERARQTLVLFAGYGLPLIAANAIYQLLPFMNRGAIAATVDFAEAGYFALAADLGGRGFTTLGMALDLLLFQLAVRADEHHGRAAAEAQIARNIAVVVALLLPCAAGYWALVPALQQLVVPQEFRGHFESYTVLLLPGFLCLALMTFAFSPIFQIRRRTSPVIAAALAGCAVNGIGLFVLPGSFGPSGVALAQSLGLGAACAILAVRAFTGAERLVLPWRDLGLSLAATLAMLAVLLPLRHLEPATALLFGVGLGASFYGVIVWIFDIAGLRSAVLEAFGRRIGVPAQ